MACLPQHQVQLPVKSFVSGTFPSYWCFVIIKNVFKLWLVIVCICGRVCVVGDDQIGVNGRATSNSSLLCVGNIWNLSENWSDFPSCGLLRGFLSYQFANLCVHWKCPRGFEACDHTPFSSFMFVRGCKGFRVFCCWFSFSFRRIAF